jgi:hypothetical protein
MRGGKTTRDPPNPNQSTGKAKEHQEAEPSTKKNKKDKKRRAHQRTSFTPATCHFPQ